MQPRHGGLWERQDSSKQQQVCPLPLLPFFAIALMTIRSSRFGKLITIRYEFGAIRGASIIRSLPLSSASLFVSLSLSLSLCLLSLSAPHSYLLEKSRVVHQQDQERNYHFFYQVVAAAADNPDLAKLLYFTDSDEHFYLSQSSVNVIEGLSDLEQFNEVQSAMEVLGMSAEQQMQVIKIVAGILHLGNISEFPNLSLTLSGLSFPLDISSLVQNSDRQTPQETQQL
jgi:hypothetical protein